MRIQTLTGSSRVEEDMTVQAGIENRTQVYEQRREKQEQEF